MRNVVSASARLCAALPAFCVVLALPGEGHSQQGGALRIATWGGAYLQSQEAAYFRPFTQESGIAVETQTYDGTLPAIKSTIDGSAPVDVIDVSRATLETLCRLRVGRGMFPQDVGIPPQTAPPRDHLFERLHRRE